MKLERSRTDCKLFGLCGGIARLTGIDATWIRLAFVIGGVLTGGTLFFLYVLASMLIPKESVYSASYDYWYTKPYNGYSHTTTGAAAHAAGSASYASTVDSMMQQLEHQAMNREIQELRAKLARFEQSR